MNLKDYLNSLCNKGYLKKEDVGLDQIKALIKGAQRNLLAAQKNLDIDEETCYAMAYYGMLKTARAIIFLNGYRPSNGQQHKTTVDAAGMILGGDFKDLILMFDKMRRKRNRFTYDPLMPPGREETKNALKTAEEFINRARKHLHRVDPQKRLFDF